MKWHTTLTSSFVPLPPEKVGAYRAAIYTLVKLGCPHLHTALDAQGGPEPWEVEDHVVCTDCLTDLTPAKPTAEIPY